MITRDELLGRLNKALEKRQLSHGMELICAYVGAEHYLVARCDGVADDTLSYVVTANWPFDLVRSLATDLVHGRAKVNEIEQCLTTLQPVFVTCPKDAHLPAHLSRKCCLIPFNAGRARLVGMLLFREGLSLLHDRLHDAALMSAYHAGSFVRETSMPERSLGLTEREIECLAWISEGKTSDEIAVIIGISPNTVNNYITGIMRKTATKTRSEAIALAVRNSLI